MPPTRVKTPVIRNLKTLFSEPLPKEPLILHMTEDQWTKLSADIPTSKRKIAPNAKGLIVIPDPFGGLLGFLACAAGSKEGVACVPEIVSSPQGGITFGRGCKCIEGKDPVEPPFTPVEQETCGFGISLSGRFACTGTCARGRTCRVVKNISGGRVLIACECS